ncbi:uncharacterized protein [Amphiura filiformis]|uniref:uncharacterized protein n=1 Tax=Amphiura filiformis TaxID=82378 RepID=UPI003B20DC26
MSGQSGCESGFASTSVCDVTDENTHGGATGILPIAAGVSAENFLSVTASSSLSDPDPLYRMLPCEPPSDDISPLSGLPTEVSNEDPTARTMGGEPAHIAAALTDEHDSSQHGVSEQSLSMDEILPSADLDDENLRINDSIEYLRNIMDVGTGSEQPPLIGHIDEALQNHPRAIGPPPHREQFYQYYQEEYIPSLSDDMMDFMDLRWRIEAGEEIEEKQSVEVSLESRRQDYFHHLPRAYWIDVRRQNVVQTLLNLYEANPDWVKRRIHVRYLSDSIQPDDENNQQFWEEGIDENGLTKDLFANLCRCPIDRFQKLVPLSVGYTEGICPERCECKQLAMLSFHGYLSASQIPKYLPKLTVMGMFCSVDKVTDGFSNDLKNIFVSEQVQSVKGAIYRFQNGSIQDEDAMHLETLAMMYDRSPPPRDPTEFEEWFSALIVDACVVKPNHFVAIFRKFRRRLLGIPHPPMRKPS